MIPLEVVPGTFKEFVGDTHTVVLSTTPSSGDEPIVVTILMKDGRYWRASTMREFHSYWLSSLIDLLQEANGWLEDHVVPYEESPGVCYGWKIHK